MGSNHLSSTALQNKTIIVQLPKIDMCVWDFQNHAKNGDSVPLSFKKTIAKICSNDKKALFL